MNRTIMTTIPLLSALVIFTGGCYTLLVSAAADHNYETYLQAKTAAPEMDAEAKALPAPADKALVYYYRTGFTRPFKESTYKVYLDEQCVAGVLWPPGFYVWTLPPGAHTFESHGSKLVLNAVGGETYYIQEQGEFFSFNLTLTLANEETGRKHISESRLFKANAAEACGRSADPSAAEARNLKPPKDKAHVYVYRKGVEYDYHETSVQLDDRQPEEIAAGTFLLWQLAPGAHSIQSSTSKVTLDAQAGATYHIRLDIVHRVWGSWHYPLQLVEKETGDKGLANLFPMEKSTK